MVSKDHLSSYFSRLVILMFEIRVFSQSKRCASPACQLICFVMIITPYHITANLLMRMTTCVKKWKGINLVKCLKVAMFWQQVFGCLIQNNTGSIRLIAGNPTSNSVSDLSANWNSTDNARSNSHKKTWEWLTVTENLPNRRFF